MSASSMFLYSTGMYSFHSKILQVNFTKIELTSSMSRSATYIINKLTWLLCIPWLAKKKNASSQHHNSGGGGGGGGGGVVHGKKKIISQYHS